MPRTSAREQTRPSRFTADEDWDTAETSEASMEPQPGAPGGPGHAHRDAALSRSPCRPADATLTPRPLRFRRRRAAGVEPPLSPVSTPGVLYAHCFDAEVLKILSHNTLKSAARNLKRGRTFPWRDVTAEEHHHKELHPQRAPPDNHYAVPTSRGQGKSQRASMGRRQCTLCKRSTPWQCEVCKVGLCVQLERNCFKSFHTTV